MDRIVADLFGFHALQLGLSALEGLRSNRMPHRWTALTGPGPGSAAMVLDSTALPFPEQSLDLVLLPHTLELSPDPHATLREVERVLVPEGRVVICGLNPASLWGFRQQRAHVYRRLGLEKWFLPQAGEFIGYWRLRDWLRLLSFEVEGGRFGCYRPAVDSEPWLNRFAWMDKAGQRWWPILGSVYFLVAIKRVRGMRLMGPVWKQAKARAGKPVPTAQSSANASSSDTVAKTQEKQA